MPATIPRPASTIPFCNVLSFKMEAAGFIALFIACVLGPLFMFTARLDRVKRMGQAEYGLLANRYLFGFEAKWIRGGKPETGELLGTQDIQALADLGNSYSFVRQMRIVPFGLDEIVRLAAITAAPLVPLTLTIWSLEQLLIRLIKVIF